MEIVDAHAVARLADRGAQIVEVLPAEEYEEEHLAGAINIPLKELDERSAGRLDRGRPVVVYCYDVLCDMSPRAARWLEVLGFGEVYDYAAGKVEWSAYGLPMEGARAAIPRAKDMLRDDAVTCRPDDRVGDVREAVTASSYGFALVTLGDGTVLGRLRGEALRGDADARVSDVMEPGPSTVRADSEVEALVERLRERDLRMAVVTGPDGRLLGLFHGADGERTLEHAGTATAGAR